MSDQELTKVTLNYKSLVEHIVESLERQIIEGQLKPGQRLVEATLCEAWGVSRSPVREAFRILESQGFLVRQARKGMFVASITPEEAEDLMQIRANLESLAISLTIKRKTPQALARLNELHQAMVQAASENNVTAYHRLNLKFHEALITSSGNRHLIELIQNLEKQIRLFRVEVLAARGLKDSVESHARIIRLIEEGDAERAESERRKRILSSIPLLVEQTKIQEKENAVVSPKRRR